MNRLGEPFQLAPQRFPVGKVPQLPRGQVPPRQLAQLQHEPQVAPLSHRAGAGTLENLHQPVTLLVRRQGGQDQQVFGRVARLLVVFRPGVRRHQHPVGLVNRSAQQAAVPRLSLRIASQAR